MCKTNYIGYIAFYFRRKVDVYTYKPTPTPLEISYLKRERKG
jgi:hypothetical protein